MSRMLRGISVALFCTAAMGAQAATTVTTQFNVTMAITAQCVVANATNMVFPTTGLLTSPVTQTSSFDVTCTNSTPYTVGLDAGQNASGAQRRMTGGPSGGEFVAYGLFTDAAHTSAWGNTTGSWVNGVGTGVKSTFTVYGQVPAQTTPSPASNYTDTVTVSVTY